MKLACIAETSSDWFCETDNGDLIGGQCLTHWLDRDLFCTLIRCQFHVSAIPVISAIVSQY